MSGQMADIVVIDDEEFALVEPGPGALFEPRDHGLSPVMSHTANMRGELARYRITDEGQLLLSDLQVGHVDQPPAINGIEPSTDEYAQVWTYLDLDIAIQWSGDVLVGADPIQDLYVHAGFAPIWHYERVVALDVEGGRVESREDRSNEVAEYRDDHDDDDDNAFERMLSAIKIRLMAPFTDDEGDDDVGINELGGFSDPGEPESGELSEEE